LDPIIPAINAHALVTAVSTGLLNALASGPADAKTIADRCNLDTQAVDLLATLLATNGYLKKVGRRFELAEVSQATLLDGSPMSFVNWILFSQFQLEAIGHLTRIVRGSGPINLYERMVDTRDRLVHQRAMAETAKPAAPWIAANTPVPPGATRMLDVGGSHGTYSAGLCTHNPPMHSDVLELPDMVETAAAVARETGTAEYCTHIGCNVLEWEGVKRYDVVFLGNIIHHFSPDEIKALLKKCFLYLVEGGTVAVWDLSVDQSSEDPISASFSLFFYLTSGSKCYSHEELKKFLTRAGFTDYETRHPPGSSSHALHIARKAGRQPR
jgi:2-polyprenyl-3-methyl-5-hydroxy-6-metoxy-1,4-benzoquinol methylase